MVTKVLRTLLAALLVLGVCVFVASPVAFAKRVYVPGVSFGGKGSGVGQFDEPVGVAANQSVDSLTDPAAGDVYVVDKGNDRVERFSATGEYKGQFDGSGAFEVEGKAETGVPAPTGRFSAPEQIAVNDDESSPSFGDVYVADAGHDAIDKFSPTGEYESQFTGFPNVLGLAVDSSGNLWLYYAKDNNHFAECGETDCAEKSETALAGGFGLAVDSSENIYANWGSEHAYKFSPGGQELGTVGPFTDTRSVSALAIDPEANGLLVDRVTSVDLYELPTSRASTPHESFAGSGELAGSHGIGVGAAGAVYLSETGEDEVKSFAYLPLPSVATEDASKVSTTGMVLHGKVNPEGEEIKECYFEYGTEIGVYTNRVACEQAPSGITGTEDVPVSATLTGLSSSDIRSFRIVATNANGAAHGSDVTVSPPALSDEAIANVGVAGAAVDAQIDAGGVATSVHLEYGTSTQYGSSTLEQSAGESVEPVSISLPLAGLSNDTAYHVRIVATNALGTTEGTDVAFATFAVPIAGLPDGRVYEPVSPTGSILDQNNYIPNSFFDFGVNYEHGIAAHSETPFQVAANGEAVTYLGDPPPTGGTGCSGLCGGNQYMATRSPQGGWTQTDLESAQIQEKAQPIPIYEAFNSDLSLGIVNESTGIVGAGAPTGYSSLYTHPTVAGAEGEYRPLSSVTPDRPAQELLYARGGKLNLTGPGYAGANAGTSTVPAFSHVLFESNAGLLEGAGKLETELGEDVKREIAEGKDSHLVHYLYDSVGGRAHLVDVLPDGDVAPGASFGSVQAESIPNGDYGLGPDFTNAISDDGGRIFWTLAPEAHENTKSLAINPPVEDRSQALYVRENDTQPQSPLGPEDECLVAADACTVQVDAGVGGGGIFQSASADGSRVFFTKGDLYEYNLETGETTNLSPGVEVQGLAGTSENGEYIYYVDSKDDIDLWHDGVTTRVASEVGEDTDQQVEGAASIDAGEVGSRLAEVTPDGHSLVFMSSVSLTGYDNKVLEDVGHKLGEEPLEEVFLYEAPSNKLTCVSCNPTGEAPVVTNASTASPQALEAGFAESVGAVLPISHEAAYQPRWISDDGGRVFFDSAQPIVPQANNKFLDVYEWERDGTGSCTSSRGCVYLVSSGTDDDNSYLIGTDATGDNVFVITRAQLVPQDRNDLDDVYDVRVGGYQPPAPPACSGTGCQGLPSPPPIFSTPASVTFNGIGNFAAPAPQGKAKKKTVKVVKRSKCAKGLHKGKKGRCVKVKTKAKRAKRSNRRAR